MNSFESALEAILATKRPGEILTAVERKIIGKFLVRLIETAAARRRQTLLTHDSLQNAIGAYFQLAGFQVDYEVPFQRGGFSRECSVFDIVAKRGRTAYIVEVKDEVTTRDLGQVSGYLNAVELAKINAHVLLGTDALNYFALLDGVVGETVKELMEREGLGVVLADNRSFAMVGVNRAQLLLDELPLVWLVDEETGEMWHSKHIARNLR